MLSTMVVMDQPHGSGPKAEGLQEVAQGRTIDQSSSQPTSPTDEKQRSRKLVKQGAQRLQ